MKLSILIPTVVGREKHFERLLSKIGTLPDLEIVVEKDNKEMSIGNKRNVLLSKATGDYLVQIDDDDDVPGGYASKIIQTIDRYNGIDCITYQELVDWNGKQRFKTQISLRHKEWSDAKGEFKYYRTPFHKSVTRSDIAKLVAFPDQRFGEDHVWSRELYPHLVTEVHIPEPMYFYNYVEMNHNVKYGIK